MFPFFLRTIAMSCPQLPVYVPSEAEKKDPALYASNVRDMMLRVGGFKASPASLQDSRAYIALLQARHREPNEPECAASSAAWHASCPSAQALGPLAVLGTTGRSAFCSGYCTRTQKHMVCCLAQLCVSSLQGKRPPKGSRAAMALEGASPEEITNGPAKKNK